MKFLISSLFIGLSFFTIAQNVGVNQNNPTHSLHISPFTTGDDPLRVDGLQAYSVGDTSLLMINHSTGVVKYINTSDFVSIISGGAGLGTDDQNIDSLILNGYTLTTFIENGNAASIDLSPLSDSISSNIINNNNFENQVISILYDNADTLLYNANFISSLQDSIDTDVDSLVLNNTTLTIYENGSNASVDLSTLSDNDADPSNELQTITKSGNTVTLSNGGGSFTDDDTQLTEAQVDAYVNNNGYLTSFTEVDGSTTNEIQTISKTGSTVTLSLGGGSFTDDDTQLTEAQVDAYVNNNGYLTSFTEVDGSTTNEIQNLSLSGNSLSISGGNNVNLSTLDDHDWYEVGGTNQPNNINDNIFTQGNVGIGIIAPTDELHVIGSGSFGASNLVSSIGVFQSTTPYKNLQNTSLWAGGSNFGGYIEGAQNGQLVLAVQDNQASDGVYFINGGGNFNTNNTYDNVSMVVRADGRVGIGTTTPTSKLEIVENTAQNALTVQKDFTGLSNTNAAFIGGTDVGFTTTGVYVLQKDNASFVGPNTNTFNVVNNSNSQFVVKGAGNVGIGTLSPTDKLQVNGHVRVGMINPPNTGSYPNYGNRLYFSGGPVGGTGNSDATDVLWMARYNEVYDRSQLRINIGDNTSGDDALHIGKFISGQTSFTTDFIFSNNGQAYKSGGGTWAATSDRRTKKDITNFTDGLNVLQQINPVTFKYNGLYQTNDDGKDYVGIIAQDVQKVAPYMIGSYEASKSPQSKEMEEILNYDGGTYMLYILVNSVKEQQQQIDALKESNHELIKQLEALKKH
ncbi:MAG: tail fiber domain-containing protein [Flavobacteriales bacterium]|jgi:hypothetical protein|nr:tail fiber domain-containing protein [Flavobacteriales bacterium]